MRGGSGGDGQVYRIFVVGAGVEHRSSIIGGGNEGDASSALGSAQGGIPVIDSRGCSNAITRHGHV